MKTKTSFLTKDFPIFSLRSGKFINPPVIPCGANPTIVGRKAKIPAYFFNGEPNSDMMKACPIDEYDTIAQYNSRLNVTVVSCIS